MHSSVVGQQNEPPVAFSKMSIAGVILKANNSASFHYLNEVLPV
jgi:hypothetical protein